MKKTLSISVAVMFLLGIVAVLFVFAGSMHPSDKVLAERSQHDISSLELGDYVVENHQRKEGAARIQIIKDWDGTVYVHMLPVDKNRIPMPEPFWGYGYYHCKDFGPNYDKNNKIVKSGKLRCHDKKAPKWMMENDWVWEYSGKSVGTWSHDMYVPNYEIKGNTVYING